ncbi:DUF3024 domain-containing protein, partial [Enterococcus sp. MMGLQ5-2]|nr:DUF3024 domain-containing protein [Enterococcus sp. MMGLQ5-2]MBS7585708.1 DUF3024 domain-containing protein [Enterococcus sp. MMGLQ5-1]MBS7578484.1 DUF3024 domain-containing protein [Enterococcus sp. MMGLQ5-2]MBS7585721.1 DUF3024 domain-containing protein [Enterococcus sp. MMGLQ5-1]NPD13567.1 DUF3024 domain-containing protein [Enterococcus sp. MMGLQ5-1]
MTFDWEGATHNWQLYWFRARKEYMSYEQRFKRAQKEA